MSAPISSRVAALAQQLERRREALKAFNNNGDITRVLEPEEFNEVRQVANHATENKLRAMLSEAQRAYDAEVGQ